VKIGIDQWLVSAGPAHDISGRHTPGPPVTVTSPEWLVQVGCDSWQNLARRRNDSLGRGLRTCRVESPLSRYSRLDGLRSPLELGPSLRIVSAGLYGALDLIRKRAQMLGQSVEHIPFSGVRGEVANPPAFRRIPTKLFEARLIILHRPVLPCEAYRQFQTDKSNSQTRKTRLRARHIGTDGLPLGRDPQFRDARRVTVGPAGGRP
jgi:hypothetical protein